MVDVAHDRDHGRARLEVGGVVVEREGVLLLLGHDLDVAAEVVGHELDELVGHGLGERERGAQQEQALDDVVGGHAEKLGELLDRGALRHLHGVELREVLVVGQRLLDALLHRGLLGLLLATLLAALAAAGGLARRLLDGHAGLLEDAAAVVGLGLAGHAAVAVLAVALAAAPLLAAPAAARGLARGGGGGSRGGRDGGGVARAGARGLRALLRAALARGLLGGGLLGLLLQDLLLLRDLVEQRGERRNALGSVVAHAVLLGLLGGAALRLGLLGLGLPASLLCGGAAALLLGTLALAALLGGDALGLGLLGGDAGLLGLGLLLGATGGLDLGRAGLEDGLELLADHGDVRVLKRRGRGLGRYLHVAEVLEHLLARHAVLLSEVVYARLCHVTYLPKERARSPWSIVSCGPAGRGRGWQP